MSFGLLSVYRGRGIEGGAGEEVHVGEGLFPALRFAVMCVGWGGSWADATVFASSRLRVPNAKAF